jgi:nucleoside-triphosphatase THEP1
VEARTNAEAFWDVIMSSTTQEFSDSEIKAICDELGPMTQREALELKLTTMTIGQVLRDALQRHKDLIAELAANVSDFEARLIAQQGQLQAQQLLIAQLQNQLSGHKRNLDKLNSTAKVSS